MEEKKVTTLLECILSKIGNLEEGQKRLEVKVTNLEEGQKRLEVKIIGLEEKTNMIFNRVGKNFEEICVIKTWLEVLETIKEDIRLIKHNLKTKSELEELQNLENRVAIIERRLTKLTHN